MDATLPIQPTVQPDSAVRVLKVVLSWIAALLWGVILLVLSLVGPKFEEIFKDFGVRLPDMTRVALEAGRALGVLGPVGAVAITLLVCAAIVMLGRAAWCNWVVPVCMVLVAVLATGTLVVSLFLPLATMIESLQGGKP